MTDDDHALARELAGEAGRRLLELRAGGGFSGEPDLLRKGGDRQSHEFLTAGLGPPPAGGGGRGRPARPGPGAVHARSAARGEGSERGRGCWYTGLFRVNRSIADRGKPDPGTTVRSGYF